MLADNIVWLKKKMPDLYVQFKAWEEMNKDQNFFLEKARDGSDTLRFQNQEEQVYFHSKYNPTREAEVIIDKLEDKEEITEGTQIVFYGVGLGYHIDEFLKRYPNNTFYFVEPSIEVLDIYLQRKLLKDYSLKNLKAIQCGINSLSLYQEIIQNRDKNLIICEHPVYFKVFEKEYSDFLDSIKKAVIEQRASLHTNYAFQKRWIINSINNFKVVLNTPNILMENNCIFERKTAILVSAGPSLNLEIENLKRIKNEGLAFIFTVGSAINTLVHHGIYPHAMCTYDPMEENQLAFEKINALKIDSIPMIFGTSVGYETLQQYPGSKFHMLTTQDTVSNYFLRTHDKREIGKVHDAPSIAVVTLELMVKLGFSQIVLVGQNLAYIDDLHYAEGIPYEVGKVNDVLLTENVSGNKVETNQSFLSMKKALEERIKICNANVVNTTVNGAMIKGTTFKPLSKLLEETLTNKVINGHEFEHIIRSGIYDMKYVFERIDNLKKEYDHYKILLIDIRSHIDELKELAVMNNVKRFKELHKRMDKLIHVLENNDFFKVFALPMNRVEYSVLVNDINKIKRSNYGDNIIKKVIKPTENFINLLYTNKSFTDNIMNVMNTIIELEKEKLASI